MLQRLSSIAFVSIAVTLIAASAQQPCNPLNDLLDEHTHDFKSDCNVTQYCDSTKPPPTADVLAGGLSGTCVYRVCRRDEFPFGYRNTTLPPLCERGQYCPDRGDGCKPVAPLNEPCELNRDDECEPPPDQTMQLKWSTVTNNNGSMCLNQRCVYANAEIGQGCSISNTVYTGYGDDGMSYTDVVVRDNCIVGSFCDPTSTTCIASLSIDSPCTSDRSCSTLICSTTSGTCSPPPSKPRHTSPVAVAFLIIAVIATLVGLVWSLLKCNRAGRVRRRAERAEAWNEQRRLRERLGHVLEKRQGLVGMEREWSYGTTTVDDSTGERFDEKKD